MADKNVLLFVYKEFLQNSKENPKKTNRELDTGHKTGNSQKKKYKWPINV